MSRKEGNPTHGMRYSQEYRAWANMHARCSNPNTANYDNYGGRGITVCLEWKDFEPFYMDMGPKPDGYVLDRIDNEKGYYKENCRWVDRATSSNNTRLRKDATSGLKGVSVLADGRYHARCEIDRVRTTLYRGKDFFEAVCARKAWEVSHEC